LINFSQQNGSNKRRKGTHCQEEVCRGTESCLESYADLSRELSIGSSSSARPPTSFLDFPDDILLPILEEFYEQRYESITPTTPLRIAEILVNKRIYLLARPLWYKRLSINEQQLDVRLAGLLRDTIRQGSLKSLTIDLIPRLANLTTFGISRLLELQNLKLILPGTSLRNDTLNHLVETVTELARLKRLTLNSLAGSTPNDRFLASYAKRTRHSNPRVVCQIRKQKYYSVISEGSLERRLYAWQPDWELHEIKLDWTDLLSLNLQGTEGLHPQSGDVVDSLRSALEVGSLRILATSAD